MVGVVISVKRKPITNIKPPIPCNRVHGQRSRDDSAEAIALASVKALSASTLRYSLLFPHNGLWIKEPSIVEVVRLGSFGEDMSGFPNRSLQIFSCDLQLLLLR